MKIEFENLKTGQIDRVFNFHKNQELFYNSVSRFPLFSGGFGAGKTAPMVLKIIKHLEYPNNLGLLGREHYKDLRNSVQKDFFDLCPANWIQKYDKTEQTVYMTNNSQLMFGHFDDMSIESIKSMNLGFFGIDQVEQISSDVFDALDGRLRRKIIAPAGLPPYVHQGMMTCNPVLFWAFKRYKQDPVEHDSQGHLRYELFESSTLDNKDNLEPSYVESLLRHPESWKRQFVYGVWDESLLADNAYFAVEYINEQDIFKRKPIRTFEGIKIYREVEFDDEYQIGVDPSEGVTDNSPIVVASKKRAEVVAVWHGKIAPDLLAQKVAQVGRIYRQGKVIPEMNSVGYATVAELKKLYDNIYKREVLDKISRETVEKYGWRTTHSTKVLLLDNFLKLMRANKVRVNDDAIISEMKTFVWTDEAKKCGLGAAAGFHDDLIMATALAFWGIDGTIQSTELQKAKAPAGSVQGVLEQIQRRNSRRRIIGSRR